MRIPADVNNFGDTISGSLAGPTGLVIILLLIVGTVALIRNMNSRLRRLPERFDPNYGRPPAGPPVPEEIGDGAARQPHEPPGERPAGPSGAGGGPGNRGGAGQ